jgi:integrase
MPLLALSSRLASLTPPAIAPPAGLEPATYGLEIRCSIQLSYGGKSFSCKDLRQFFAASIFWLRYRPRYPSLDTMGEFTSPVSCNRDVIVKKKPTKPRGFPLTANGNGQWSKKIRGRVHYFGKWEEPDKALQRYLDEKDYLEAGRRPPNLDGHTILEVCDRFLIAKRGEVETGDITERTFRDYLSNCKLLVSIAGDMVVEGMTPEDFGEIRTQLKKGKGGKEVGTGTLASRVRMARVALRYFEQLTGEKLKWGKAFREPPARLKRKARLEAGIKMHSAEEINAALEATEHPQLRAMIYLGINVAFQNSDFAGLDWEHLDLKGGWHNFEREKTYIPRRGKLWPETINALRALGPKKSGRVFTTKYGNEWKNSAIQHEVQDLGLKFSWLRKTFRTVAERKGDLIACRLIMGHVAGSQDMDSIYVQKVYDEKLEAIAEDVRQWLLGCRA